MGLNISILVHQCGGRDPQLWEKADVGAERNRSASDAAASIQVSQRPPDGVDDGLNLPFIDDERR